MSFVAPGIVHRLGNAMFTIQGHAQLLVGVGPEGRERRSILAAVERSARTLALMRALLGHQAGAAENAIELLALLGDVLGVPVRESGHTLTTRLPEDTDYRGVDPGAFCPVVLEAVRVLIGVLPSGQVGRIELALVDGDGSEVVVQVRFTAKDGSLPFPLDTGEIEAALGRVLLAMRPRPALRIARSGFDIGFGGQAGNAPAEATGEA